MSYVSRRAACVAFVIPLAWVLGCEGSDPGGRSTQDPGLSGFPTAGITGGTAGATGLGAAGFPAVGGAGDGSLPGTAGFGTAGFGAAGFEGTAGMGDFAGAGGIGAAGVDGLAGAGGAGGEGGTGGTGTCCTSGDCLCHGPDPSALTSSGGQYKTAQLKLSTGTAYYPTDAEPPFAAVAVCGGFTNTGPEMADWGPFYASHGIVTIITTTLGSDNPDIRATKLLGAIAELKSENAKSGSPLFGKLAGRYGTSGYSMGGGGTTIASGDDPTLKTSIGLAAWGGVGQGVKVPTLLLCGTSDTTAACSMSKGAYDGIPSSTPKMMISIQGATHFNWFGPTSAGSGTSGKYALAFQKVYLEGDERWKSLLLGKPSNGTTTTNIQ